MIIRNPCAYYLLALSIAILIVYMQIDTALAQKQTGSIIVSGQDAEFSASIQPSAKRAEIVSELPSSVNQTGADRSMLYTLNSSIDPNVLAVLDLSIATTAQEAALNLSFNFDGIANRPSTNNLNRISVTGADAVKIFEMVAVN